MQTSAARQLERSKLIISLLLVAILWATGALIFWTTEKAQKWSYFEAFYFSYTILMTIGYGDFQPETESAKPFFVFWTLLAVPTLTILVSHMRGTLFKGFKDLVVWIYQTCIPTADHLRFVGSLRCVAARGNNKTPTRAYDIWQRDSRSEKDGEGNLASVQPHESHQNKRKRSQTPHLEATDSTKKDLQKSGEAGQEERRRYCHPTAESKSYPRSATSSAYPGITKLSQV
jgi:hypothetical protein